LKRFKVPSSSYSPKRRAEKEHFQSLSPLEIQQKTFIFAACYEIKKMDFLPDMTEMFFFLL